MHKIIFFISIFFLSVVSNAQQTRLSYQLKEKIKISNGNENIRVLVKGDMNEIQKIVQQEGGLVRYSAGNIASVNIPVKNVEKLAQNKKITRIESGYYRPKTLNDTMVINNNVKPVNDGQAPLTQGYTGKGVVFGMVDSGIDYTHPDFLDSAGKTRIKFLWDQTKPDSLNTPQPYGYGQEWLSAEIDSGYPHNTDLSPEEGHGTGVASIGAGNGHALNKFAGVAPDADLVVVTLDFFNTTDATIVDGVNYIFSKADSLGEPCVINLSVGDYLGSHDGKDLQAQIIDSMITAKTGRVIVAASGNSGQDHFHLGYTVTADTNFTWFESYSSPIFLDPHFIFFNIWADTADFRNVKFSVGADQATPSFSFRGETPFTDIFTSLNTTVHDTIYNNGNRIGAVETSSELVGGTYSLWVVITTDSLNYNWRFSTTGSGKFDAWNLPWLTGTSTVVSTGLPSLSELPEIAFYKAPDTTQTMVSSFQCSDHVITVGAYTNRRQYIDYNNNLNTDPTKIPGQFAAFSSQGPTRDGRIKPDICSSGDYIISAHPLASLAGRIVSDPAHVVQGGFHLLKGGTSSASPIVAGIAALYLQKCPSASALEIKNTIINHPKIDSFTGSALPDNKWGYGKVDAFSAISAAPCGLASVSDNLKKKAEIFIYPNPFNNSATIHYELDQAAGKETVLEIFNVLGKVVKTMRLNNNIGEVVFSRENLSPGIYFCNLSVDGNVVGTNKLMIL